LSIFSSALPANGNWQDFWQAGLTELYEGNYQIATTHFDSAVELII